MGLFFQGSKRKAEPDPKTVQPLISPQHSGDKQKKYMLSYRFGSVQGIGKRKQQEDAFCLVNTEDVTKIRQKGFLAVVADGMGGMQGGDYAGRAVISVLEAFFDEVDYSENIAEQLNHAIREAGSRIYDSLNGCGGSTVVACLFYNGDMYYSSVGDSYLMLKRNGELLRINRPQNVKNKIYLENIREYSTDGTSAENNPEKDALTGFLGMSENEDIDYFVKAMPLYDGDVIMLCSDGMAGVLSNKCLSNCMDLPVPALMCMEMERCIKEANLPFQDNYTAIIIKCEL